MRNNIETSIWKTDLAAFGKRNHMRPTRLEVLGPDRNMESDFWLEDGLLLAGLELETDGEGVPSVEIMLQQPAATFQDHMTHSVGGVKRLKLDTADEKNESLEIEDKEGTVTIMRFESEVTSQDRNEKK